MLTLAALLFAAPPVVAPAPAIDPAGIALQLAMTAPQGRAELLNEFSQLCTDEPWAAKATAMVRGGSPDPAFDGARARLGSLTTGAAVLGLAGCAPVSGILLAPLQCCASASPTSLVARPTVALWPVGEAPDMPALRDAVAQFGRYTHSEDLLALAQAHRLRGEPALAKTRLAEAIAHLRGTPDVEFAAGDWDTAQALSLQLGDPATALALLQHRTAGSLAALDEWVQHALEFDEAKQVARAVPVLFSMRPGVDDAVPEARPGCADAWAPDRWTLLSSWSETLLLDANYPAHRALVRATPDASIREALRAKTVESLLEFERHDAAAAVLAEMGLTASEVALGACAGIEAVDASRHTARVALIESAASAERSAPVLKAVQAALATGEVAEIDWDLVNDAVGLRGEMPALAALMAGANMRNAGVRDARARWVDATLLGTEDQAVYSIRGTLARLLTDADLRATLDESVARARADLADAALPDDAVITPRERLDSDLAHAQMFLERGDTPQVRAALQGVWSGLVFLDGDDTVVNQWPTWARLALLTGDGEAAVGQIRGLADADLRAKAARALGEQAAELHQGEVCAQAAVALATSKAPEEMAKAGCASRAGLALQAALGPWIDDWARRGRFDVAVQIAQTLPPDLRAQRLAGLVVEMAEEGRYAEALALAPDVARDAEDPCGIAPSARDAAWLGLIDAALQNARLKAAERAVAIMPDPTNVDRFADLVWQLYARRAEAASMPDLSAALARPGEARRRIVRAAMIRAHLAEGRVAAALSLASDADRRTRMRLLLAIAGESEGRLAPHAAAIRNLGP